MPSPLPVDESRHGTKHGRRALRRTLDAVVETADAASGVLRLRTLDGDEFSVWSAGGAALEAPAGTPVALHAAYDVLAVGRVQYNVAR